MSDSDVKYVHGVPKWGEKTVSEGYAPTHLRGEKRRKVSQLALFE